MVVVLPSRTSARLTTSTSPTDDREITGRSKRPPRRHRRTSAIQYKKTTKTSRRSRRSLAPTSSSRARAWRNAYGGTRARRPRSFVRATARGVERQFDKPTGPNFRHPERHRRAGGARAMDVTLNPGDRRVVRSALDEPRALEAVCSGGVRSRTATSHRTGRPSARRSSTSSRRCGSIRASRQLTRGLPGFTLGWVQTGTTSV
jgi:hypothetical protein